METAILLKAQAELLAQFNQQQPLHLLYHSYQHSLEVVQSCLLIAQAERLDEPQTELLLLAAYFHDIGYLQSYKNHEDHSKNFAQSWLHSQNYPQEAIAQVLACIEATRYGHKPTGILEQIISDADLSYGIKRYKLRSKLLRAEWESPLTLGKSYDKLGWLKLQSQFLQTLRFYTDYGRQHFAPLASQHLIAESKKLSELEKEKAKSKKAKTAAPSNGNNVYAQIETGIPSKGIQSFFRTVYSNLISMSAIADNKANFMISINSIVLTLLVAIFSIGGMSFKYVSQSIYVLPIALFIGTGLVSLILAVLSVMPLHKLTQSKPLTQKNLVENIIAFNEFAKLPLDQYEELIQQMLASSELLYGNMSRDLYQLGCQLEHKYKLLRFAYFSFLLGFALSSLALLLVFLFQTPNDL